MTNEELAVLIRAGERERLVDLWEQTGRFIRKQAFRRAQYLDGAAVDVEDLTQAGFLALVAAVDSFDPAAGCSFIGWLNLRLRTAFNQAAGARTDRQRQDPIHHCSSLNTPLDDEDGYTLEDVLSDPDSFIAFEDVDKDIWNQQLHVALEKALERIPANQAHVVRNRYFKGNTLQQTGNEIGLSRARVQQLEEDGIRSLREPAVSETLEEFIERQTPYFLHVGVSEFHRTQTSAVEKIALLREKMRTCRATERST